LRKFKNKDENKSKNENKDEVKVERLICLEVDRFRG
jgi:hypothetical protein